MSGQAVSKGPGPGGPGLTAGGSTQLKPSGSSRESSPPGKLPVASSSAGGTALV